MKKLHPFFFVTILISTLLFCQLPVFAEDETETDIPPVSSETSPEDESEEDAPPSEEEEEPSEGEEQDPENPEPGEGSEDEPPPEDDTGEEITPDITVDLTALSELLEQDFFLMYEEVSTIRKNTDIIIYFVIPVLCAILLICKLGLWFYSTFIKDAL